VVQDNDPNKSGRGSDLTNHIHLIPQQINGLDKEYGSGLLIHGLIIIHQKFASNVDLVEVDKDALQENLEWIN